MLDHISIGVANLAASKAFYDAALHGLGSQCLYEDSGSLGYGADKVTFWVLATTEPVQTTESSGLHFCFAAASRQAVDAFHAAALRSGGQDNGPPGVRSAYDPSYYAAFVVDPDGYRLEAYCGATT